MKLTYLLLLSIVLPSVQHALAQDTARHRLVISISGGPYLPQRPGRNVFESFVYTSTPVGSSTSRSALFSGSLGGNYPPAGFVGDVLHFEITSGRHAINTGIGLFQTSNADDGGYLKIGYARVLHFHRNRFRFQPGADLYGILGGKVEMGRIEDFGQTLQFLGFTAPAQWTDTYTNRSGTHTDTFIADHLSVRYRRNALLLEPKLELSATLGRLVLGLEAGWMLQLSQGAVVVFKQVATNGYGNNFGLIHQPNNGTLSGLYTSLIVGVIHRPRHKVKK
jgi:hypothetical protein